MQVTQNRNSTSIEVAKEFGKSVSKYHKEAIIQKKVAEGLIASVRPWKEIIPTGPILEVGCGTGFLSEHIVNEFPDRLIEITDASQDMVDFTRSRLDGNETVFFSTLNVDEIMKPKEQYALIVCNFAPQWFNDTAVGLETLTEMLVPGGLLLTAFPGNHSFTEWYECCLELGIPFTANTLPDVEEIVVKLSLGPLQIDYYENNLFQDFEHSIEFLKHLKQIGAGKSISGKSLSLKQLKLLTSFWDEKVQNKIKAKWHVVYLAAKKDMR